MNKTIVPKEVMEILDTLESGAYDSSWLVSMHTRVGYWTAISQGDWEHATDERKYAEADTMLAAKLADPKMSAAMAEANGVKAVKPLRDVETTLKTQAQKLANLFESLTVAIVESGLFV
jgi:hypothetical protein